MITKEEIKDVYVINDGFFAFKSSDIIAYSNMDREFILEEKGIIKLGGAKEKKNVDSISGLKSIMQDLVVEEMIYNEGLALSPHGEIKYYSHIRPNDIELLINQLVFDVLCDKHRSDTKITLSEYCEKYYYINYGDSWNNIPDIKIGVIDASASAKDSAYHNMKRWLKAYTEKMKEPRYRRDLIKRGVCPDLFNDYVNQKNMRFQKDVTKLKWIWDLIYYDKTLHAYTQYRRDSRGNSEKDLKEAIKELNEYDSFVKEVFVSSSNSDGIKYFNKTIDFYYLESLSQLEFIYKLAERLELDGITDINDCRFVLNTKCDITVSTPTVVNDEGEESLSFYKKRNIYGSMPLITKSWLDEMSFKINETANNPFYSSQWLHLIRVQAYELFMYHYEFNSKNYNDIVTFLKEDYNILDAYYNSEKIYKDVKESSDVPLSPEQKKRITLMRMIRNNTFIKFNKGFINRWLASDDKTDEDYVAYFGMDKETFEKLLSIRKRR